MGQQQLLLIVLGVIIVGIAIVVGINLFNASSVEANRNSVVADLNTLGAMAQQYYKKPASMGGGDKTFTGWTIPTGLSSNSNGSYTVTVAAQSLTITGTGTQNGDSGSKLVHTATVTPTTITVAKTN